jgi:lipopolysaccharide transport system ATP-binding protein
MSDTAIEVLGLGKSYQISSAARGGRTYKTLREDLMSLPRAFWSRIKGRREKLETIWALKDVSFEVKQGEVLGIIGRNGAGKSTLLKILSRITEPTRGRADLYGRVGSLLEVGTGFHPELTGRENIFLNGTILGMRRAEVAHKFDAIVSFSEVQQFIDVPVKRYSSGMYMRLAFAVAAHLDPEIMVIDEVLAVGDAEFQKKCIGKMKEVGKAGRTVLFVSHNMNAVEQLCTRAMLLDKGCIKNLSDDVRLVIKDHLFGFESEGNSSEWLNTGLQFDNPWFKPLHFCITDEKGQRQGMPLANDSDMWVQIEAEVALLDPGLTVGYAIYSEEGHLLYWSYQTDEAQENWPALHKGKCLLRSRIPKRFLNEGVYRLEVIGGLHHREWLFEPGVNAPSIYLIIQGGLSDSPVWMIKRPGILAPVMRWFMQDNGS